MSAPTISGRRPIIGVMGGATVSKIVIEQAFALGAAIAENDWILLNGGRDAGVMRASAQGAKSKNGLTIGILPGGVKYEANPFIDIPIVTAMSDARNLVNVLSSDAIIACQGSAGTISEIALALKNNKPVILLNFDCRALFQQNADSGLLFFTDTVAAAIQTVRTLV